VAKKIKIPSGVGSGRPRTKYKFDLLKEVGDSFFIDGNVKHSIYSSLAKYNLKAKTPIKITIRTESTGVRVWRIK
jgi:hypothetical protein